MNKIEPSQFLHFRRLCLLAIILVILFSIPRVAFALPWWGTGTVLPPPPAGWPPNGGPLPGPFVGGAGRGVGPVAPPNVGALVGTPVNRTATRTNNTPNVATNIEFTVWQKEDYIFINGARINIFSVPPGWQRGQPVGPLIPPGPGSQVGIENNGHRIQVSIQGLAIPPGGRILIDVTLFLTSQNQAYVDNFFWTFAPPNPPVLAVAIGGFDVRRNIGITEYTFANVDPSTTITVTELRFHMNSNVFLTGKELLERSGWRDQGNVAFSGGSLKYTDLPCSESIFNFTGIGVTWIAEKGPNRGIAEVFIDDVFQGSVDLYGAISNPQQAVFTKTGLANTSHTLKIKVPGQKNASASDFTVDVDAMDVNTGAGIQRYEETSPSFQWQDWEINVSGLPYVLPPGNTLTVNLGTLNQKSFLYASGKYQYSGSPTEEEDFGDVHKDSTPVCESSDLIGNKKDIFYESSPYHYIDSVYTYGHGYEPNKTYDLYIVSDKTWHDGDTIPHRISGTAVTVTTNNLGVIPAGTLIWEYPKRGEYDIVVDVNGNGIYDEGIDGLDSSSPGFIVIVIQPIGYNISWLIITAISLMLAGGYLIFRQRRKFAQSNSSINKN